MSIKSFFGWSEPSNPRIKRAIGNMKKSGNSLDQLIELEGIAKNKETEMKKLLRQIHEGILELENAHERGEIDGYPGDLVEQAGYLADNLGAKINHERQIIQTDIQDFGGAMGNCERILEKIEFYLSRRKQAA